MTIKLKELIYRANNQLTGSMTLQTPAHPQVDKKIYVNGRESDRAVSLLKQAKTYPDQPEGIDVIETHMSWVFLTLDTVYKLKKSVSYDFLDFSNLSSRKKFCAEEVRLNRRLAKDVYLGIVPLVLNENGNASLGPCLKNPETDKEDIDDRDNVRVLDWLVKMRRLPAEKMLDQMILQKTLGKTDIQNLSQCLIDFYLGCDPVIINPGDYLETLMRAVKLNFSELSKPEYGLDHKLVNSIQDFQLAALRDQTTLFTQRAEERKLLEGHGDLRPEHICLEDKPVIFDCLEFNRELRIVDSIDEISSLSMECELMNVPEVGEALFEYYKNKAEDEPSELLINFYKSYRACVRARLAILHVKELEKAEWPKWQNKAEKYLYLAENYSHVI